MELRHLRYAVAVANAGSFTRAAMRLRVAQQALSQQIADLERELGVRLFDRTTRGISPTPAGLAFLEGARETLVHSDRAIALARGGADPPPARLTIGVDLAHRVFERFLLEVIAEVRAAAPGLELIVHRVQPANAFARLRRGSLDLALSHATPEDEEAFAAEAVAEAEQCGVLLPAGHPLAARCPLRLRDLCDFPLLAPPRIAGVGADGSFAALLARDLSPRLSPLRLAGPTETVARAVARGWGWMLALPPSESEFLVPGVVFRPIADPPVPLRVWLLHSDRLASSQIHAFVKACRETRLGPARPGSGPREVPRRNGVPAA